MFFIFGSAADVDSMARFLREGVEGDDGAAHGDSACGYGHRSRDGGGTCHPPRRCRAERYRAYDNELGLLIFNFRYAKIIYAYNSA